MQMVRLFIAKFRVFEFSCINVIFCGFENDVVSNPQFPADLRRIFPIFKSAENPDQDEFSG